MLPKQVEMDGIVKLIYTSLTSEAHLESTLFVLCGDHGMNEGGNHGGSAPGETSPALLFMSPKLKAVSQDVECPSSPRGDFDYYHKVEQSDIVPTLAGLLGIPVPQNNLGVFIPDFLSLWPSHDDRVQLLLRNALQMLTIVKSTFHHEAFESPFAELDCSNPSSSVLELACRCRRVTDIFRAAGGAKPAPTVLLEALTDVSLAAGRLHLPMKA